jgi:hypothetical protein
MKSFNIQKYCHYVSLCNNKKYDLRINTNDKSILSNASL